MRKILNLKHISGVSVIEVIIAVSIFVIIASASVVTILGTFGTTRLADEQSRALFFAIEGSEAANSIRNQSWSSLIDGEHGITDGSGAWSFSGSNDILGKFNRIVRVSSVMRDEAGEIVETGGTIDNNTKKITSVVTWNFIPTKTTTVELTAFLANWQEVSNLISPAPTGEPTVSPTFTPTPTAVVINSCESLCAANGYSAGSCRRNAGACSSSGETYFSGGDQYCTGGSEADTCCCLP